MTNEKPAHSLDKFILRMPDGMRERIAAVAKQNGRSMNAEIVDRLEKSFLSYDSEKIPVQDRFVVMSGVLRKFGEELFNYASIMSDEPVDTQKSARRFKDIEPDLEPLPPQTTMARKLGRVGKKPKPSDDRRREYMEGVMERVRRAKKPKPSDTEEPKKRSGIPLNVKRQLSLDDDEK